jgi:hypothetical protein
MVKLGYQTYAGFLVARDDLRVLAVEPGSAAEAAGLRPGDLIRNVNGVEVTQLDRPGDALLGYLSSGQEGLTLTVVRDGQAMTLPTFRAHSLGLHPTQLYETISMVLLCFFLLSYYPYKRHDGAVMVFLMLGYGIHRFLNEMLRVDNEIVAFNMTFSQLVSILVLLAAGVLAYFVWRRPAVDKEPAPSPPVPSWS